MRPWGVSFLAPASPAPFVRPLGVRCLGAVEASYLSIDSTRSSGSQNGMQGPRRRWGFETRSETPFATRSLLDNPQRGWVESFTSTDAFIASNWGALSDTRLSSAPHDGARTAYYAVLALRAVRPALAGGRAALASAGAERRSFFAARSRILARLAVRLACSRTPRALSSASRAPS